MRPQDPSEAQRDRDTFLHNLFDSVAGYIDLRFIWPDQPGAERVPVESIDEALAEITKHDGEEVNVYVGIATRRNRARAKGAGGKTNLAATRGFWVDVDLSADNPEGAREALQVALEAFPHPPSMVIFSGCGVHLYWLLEEPHDLTDAVERERFEDVLRGVCDFVGGDRAATDASRILRVPGTVNWPDERKREKGREAAQCVIETPDTGARFSLSDFDPFEIRGREIRGRAQGIEYDRELWDGELPETTAQLVSENAKVRARWEGDTNGLHDASDSGLDMALATLLALHGIKGAEIEAALRFRRSKVGAREKGPQYYHATVKKALGSASEMQKEAENEHKQTTADDSMTEDDCRETTATEALGRVKIELGRRQPREMIGEMVKSVVTRNDPPRWFRRAGRVVQVVRGDRGVSVAREIPPGGYLNVLNAVADFQKRGRLTRSRSRQSRAGT